MHACLQPSTISSFTVRANQGGTAIDIVSLARDAARGTYMHPYLQLLEGQLQPLAERLWVGFGRGLALQYECRPLVLLEGMPELDLARAVTLSGTCHVHVMPCSCSFKTSSCKPCANHVRSAAGSCVTRHRRNNTTLIAVTESPLKRSTADALSLTVSTARQRAFAREARWVSTQLE